MYFDDLLPINLILGVESDFDIKLTPLSLQSAIGRDGKKRHFSVELDAQPLIIRTVSDVEHIYDIR